MRRPSAEILQQIAKALRISAEQLYVHAGFLDAREGSQELVAAVLADTELTERQKQVLLEIYDSFRKENAVAPAPAAPPAEKKARPRKAAARPAGPPAGERDEPHR